MAKGLLLALGLAPRKKGREKDADDLEEEDEDTSDESTSEEQIEAAEDVLRAIEDKDASALADALRLFNLLCHEDALGHALGHALRAVYEGPPSLQDGGKCVHQR